MPNGSAILDGSMMVHAQVVMRNGIWLLFGGDVSLGITDIERRAASAELLHVTQLVKSLSLAQYRRPLTPSAVHSENKGAKGTLTRIITSRRVNLAL
jgi:hypothetical protein